MTEDTAEHAQPLTVLAEDETIFRDSVRAFAEAAGPSARPRDGRARQDSPRRSSIELFELGVMGIEIPEAYGGAGGTFLSRRARRRGAFARRSVDRRAGRRAEHARHQRPAPLRQRRASSDAGCPRSRPTRSARTRCQRPAPAATRSRSPRARARTATATSSPAASSGSPTATRPISSSFLRRSIPMPAIAGSPRFSSNAACAGFTVGKKEDKLGIRASSTCELDLR